MTVTPSRFHWKFKALAALDQAPPVQNTWYTVLDTVSKARLYSLVFKQINDEAAVKNIDFKVTADGLTLENSADRASGIANYFYQSPYSSSVAWIQNPNYIMSNYYIAFHAKSLKVEMRTTSAAGTNQHLCGYVRYARLEAL